MAETEDEPQTLDPGHDPPLLAKRKPVADCVDEGEEEERKTKQPKPDTTAPLQADCEEGSEDDGEASDPNGHAATGMGKGVLTAVDKGKGKMVVEDEDSDDSTDGDSSDGIGGEGDDDSDFSDDPLAEVDPSNVLPSRTRRRVALQHGIRNVADREEDGHDMRRKRGN